MVGAAHNDEMLVPAPFTVVREAQERKRCAPLSTAFPV
jgi:hypothetical protein